MQLDLSPHIIKLLYTNDTVTIPGLGSFVSQSAASTVDYAGNTVSPPTKALSFNDNLIYDDGLLTDELSKTLNISTEEAKDQIDAAVAKMQILLNQREIVALDGIGRLYKNYVQKIQFLPDAINFRKDTFGLQPLQFSPIAKSREVSGTAPVEAPQVQPQASVTQNPSVETSSTPLEQTPVRPPASVFPSTTGSSSPIPPVYEPTPSAGFPWARTLLILLLIGMSVGLTYYLWQKQQAESLATAKKSPIEAPANDATDSTVPNEEPKNESPVQEKTEILKPKANEPLIQPEQNTPTPQPKPTTTTPPSTGSQRITLMIGVFKDEVNIDRLTNKLTDNGYKVYSSVAKNGGTMIGVNLENKSMAEVQQTMIALQKLTGEQNIWIKKR